MISAHTISKIKDDADVIDVLGDFITLKKAGSNYKANCPFHNEKTPSFVVSPAKGIYKCFGCGKAGDSVKFVMEHEQMNYVEALRYLAAKYNIEIEETEVTDEEREAQTVKDSLYIINNFARDTFHNNLLNHEEGRSIGLSYLKERGFSDAIIETFQLGYTLESSSYFTDLALSNGYQHDIIKQAGLTSKKEGTKYDFFRGRVMFPIHSVSGKVLGFGGRTLKSNTKQAKYVNTPDTDIYDKSAVLYGMYFSRNEIRKQANVFLVEGYTDVISLHQAGVTNVVASSGTSLTQQQVRLIKRYTPNITLLYDGDKAGIKAALRGVDIILENGLNVKVCLLPEDHDPDSFIREKGQQGFEDYVEEHNVDFLIFKSKQLSEEAKNDPIKKAENVQDIVASIAKIPEAIKRTIYVKECADLIGLPEQVLATEVNKERSKLNKKDRDKQQREARETAVAVSDVLEDEALVEAGINLEFYERNVLRTLLEHGTRPFNEELSTAAYLMKELEQIPFENATHSKFLSHAKVLIETGSINELMSNKDEEISNFAITLVASPHDLSENWYKKHKIVVPDASLTYRDDVQTELYWLRFWRLKTVELELMKRLQNATEEDLSKLLKMKKKLDEQKVALGKEKNLTITRN